MGGVRWDERGMTIVELMVGSVITLVIISSAMATYLALHRVYVSQGMVADANQSSRMAVSTLAKHIRLARSGADPATAIQEACACRLVFQCDRHNVRTFLINAGTGPGIPVESIEGFKVNDTVWVTDWSMWVSRTITAVQASPPQLTLNGALPASFPSGAGVFQSTTISYDLDTANRRLRMDGRPLEFDLSMDANGYFGTEPLFRYYDAADGELVADGTGSCLNRCLNASQRRAVRKVRVHLEVETPQAIQKEMAAKGIITQETVARLRHPTP